MSTRSQIQHEDYPNIYLYRHSDGYPCGKHGVLASLLPFLRWFDKERGIVDGAYCLARCLEHMIRDTKMEGGALSYGIDDQQHGDIEYLYTINKDKTVTIKHWGWTNEIEADIIVASCRIPIDHPIPEEYEDFEEMCRAADDEVGLAKFFKEEGESL